MNLNKNERRILVRMDGTDLPRSGWQSKPKARSPCSGILTFDLRMQTSYMHNLPLRAHNALLSSRTGRSASTCCIYLGAIHRQTPIIYLRFFTWEVCSFAIYCASCGCYAQRLWEKLEEFWNRECVSRERDKFEVIETLSDVKFKRSRKQWSAQSGKFVLRN